MRVYMPIETASRELPYKVYLSALLSLEGFECYIGTKSSIIDLIGSTNNFVYLDKGFHDGVSQEYYRAIKMNQGLIFSLDEEGAVDYPDHRIIKHRYAKELFEFVDHIFFWGEKQLSVVKSNISDLGKISVSGHPRFQLLSKEFRSIYRTEVDAIKAKYGKYVLVNSNMSFGNNINGDDFIKRNYSDRFENLDEIISFDKEKCSLLIKAIQILANDSNQSIVVRPHPEEDIEFYRTQLKDYSNVHVLYEGSVVPWILGSEYIVHPDCTTALEAIFLGKGAISLLPKDYDANIVTSLPLKVSHQVTELSKLLDVVRLMFSEEGKSNQFNSTLNEYFNIGSSSFDHIIDRFKRIERSSANLNINGALLKQKFKTFLREVFNTIAPKSLARINKLSENKTKDFNSEWVNSLLSHFLVSNSNIKRVYVKKIHPGLFVIKNK